MDEARRKIRSSRKFFGEHLGREGNYGRNTEEIVAWMLLEPQITIEEIAYHIEKSTSTVEKTIKKLKEANILEREGSTKAGFWKINL